MSELPNDKTCRQCGAPLSYTDICLHKKLLSRSAVTFFCMDCMAVYCNTTRERLEAYIAHLRKTGTCSLFPPLPDENNEE
ncbi:MAG: hypothetical protein IJU16_00155 [Clostridia bacterium]|nr:hypothetical protein [Clostridia bacterium]